MGGPNHSTPWRVAARLLQLLDHVVAPTDTVVLHSSPDLDDTVVALLRGVPASVRATVIVDRPSEARLRAAALGITAHLVARRSRAGLWAYLRARVTLSTHGLFGSPRRRRGRRTVGLWHGEFGKTIGHFAGEPTRHFDWMPVSSHLSRSLRSAEFGLPPESIHVVGYPRQDFFATPPAFGGSTIVWAPTFRSTVAGRARVDGDPTLLAGTLALDDVDLLALLERHDATLWFRPHPSETARVPEAGGRVRTATNADLEVQGITLYELLAAADVFITDYSSMWVDHLLRDRPMISFCPDLEVYRRTRGLALEPHERWFAGPVVATRADLLDALEAAIDGADLYGGRRAATRDLLHTAPAGSAVPRVWGYVTDVLAGHDEDDG